MKKVKLRKEKNTHLGNKFNRKYIKKRKSGVQKNKSIRRRSTTKHWHKQPISLQYHERDNGNASNNHINDNNNGSNRLAIADPRW